MLFGQEDKITLFKKIIGAGQLGHAYLFYGDAEIGKFSFAKSLAYFLESKDFGFSEEPLLDAQVFTPDEKGVIGIDAIREIKSFLRQTPFKAAKRTLIIDGAEALTAEAQSALLKIAEEAPSAGLLIFIASGTGAILPPLLSRLVKVYFRRLPKEKIEEILVGEYGAPVAKAKKIAGNSFGRIGRAVRVLRGEAQTRSENKELESDLENKILALWQGNVFKNARLIAWLLEKETALKRFNLNKNLQKKAIQNKIYSYESAN